jgi:iron complex transport system substrate-binding protein
VRLRALGLALLLAAPATAAPLRVATLLPCVADAVAGLPAEKVVLVATVRSRLHEPVANGVVDLGTPHAPSLERLAEARADLVVGEQRLHGAQGERLATGGAELLFVDSSSLDGTFAGLLALAARASATAEMEARVAEVRSTLATLHLAEPVPVLALFATPGAFLAVGDATWLGDLLRRLGFENLAPSAAPGGSQPGYVPLSDEALSELRPELLLLLSHGDPTRVAAEFERRLAGGPWTGLRAGARRGVHVLDPALFQSNPGLRVTDAARALTALAASSPPALAVPSPGTAR